MENVYLGFKIIKSEKELDLYLEKIESEEESAAELRYISHTSMNGEQSFVARIRNHKIHAQLLAPHFWNVPHMSKQIIRKPQELHELVRKGLRDKAHLILKKWKKIGQIIVENTDERILCKEHTKHLVDVLSYEKYDWTYRDFIPFEENYAPIWLHESVIQFYFKRVVEFYAEQRRHTQYDSFIEFQSLKH